MFAFPNSYEAAADCVSALPDAADRGRGKRRRRKELILMIHAKEEEEEDAVKFFSIGSGFGVELRDFGSGFGVELRDFGSGFGVGLRDFGGQIGRSNLQGKKKTAGSNISHRIITNQDSTAPSI